MNKKLISLLLVVFLLTSCAPPEQNNINPSSSGDYYPVTVESCGEEITFDTAPERALVFDTNMIEIMLALELEDHIVGHWISGAAPVSDKYQEQMSAIPLISEEQWPPPGYETILSFDPDFVFGGWGYVFFEESGVTPENLADAGVKSYTLSESCIQTGIAPDETFESTYRDILNIGRIFGVEERATAIVDQMQTDIASIQKIIGDVDDPIKALYYGGGTDAAFTSGKHGMPTKLMNAVGATNIFSDVEADWIPEASWETIIERDPEVIIIDDTPWANGEDSIAILTTLPQLQSVTAIREGNFIVVPWTYILPGVDIDESVKMLAHELYPELFQ